MCLKQRGKCFCGTFRMNKEKAKRNFVRKFWDNRIKQKRVGTEQRIIYKNKTNNNSRHWRWLLLLCVCRKDLSETIALWEQERSGMFHVEHSGIWRGKQQRQVSLKEKCSFDRTMLNISCSRTLLRFPQMCKGGEYKRSRRQRRVDIKILQEKEFGSGQHTRKEKMFRVEHCVRSVKKENGLFHVEQIIVQEERTDEQSMGSSFLAFLACHSERCSRRFF